MPNPDLVSQLNTPTAKRKELVPSYGAAPGAVLPSDYLKHVAKGLEAYLKSNQNSKLDSAVLVDFLLEIAVAYHVHRICLLNGSTYNIQNKLPAGTKYADKDPILDILKLPLRKMLKQAFNGNTMNLENLKNGNLDTFVTGITFQLLSQGIPEDSKSSFLNEVQEVMPEALEKRMLNLFDQISPPNQVSKDDPAGIKVFINKSRVQMLQAREAKIEAEKTAEKLKSVSAVPAAAAAAAAVSVGTAVEPEAEMAAVPEAETAAELETAVLLDNAGDEVIQMVDMTRSSQLLSEDANPYLHPEDEGETEAQSLERQSETQEPEVVNDGTQASPVPTAPVPERSPEQVQAALRKDLSKYFVKKKYQESLERFNAITRVPAGLDQKAYQAACYEALIGVMAANAFKVLDDETSGVIDENLSAALNQLLSQLSKEDQNLIASLLPQMIEQGRLKKSSPHEVLPDICCVIATVLKRNTREPSLPTTEGLIAHSVSKRIESLKQECLDSQNVSTAISNVLLTDPFKTMIENSETHWFGIEKTYSERILKETHARSDSFSEEEEMQPVTSVAADATEQEEGAIPPEAAALYAETRRKIAEQTKAFRARTEESEQRIAEHEQVIAEHEQVIAAMRAGQSDLAGDSASASASTTATAAVPPETNRFGTLGRVFSERWNKLRRRLSTPTSSGPSTTTNVGDSSTMPKREEATTADAAAGVAAFDAAIAAAVAQFRAAVEPAMTDAKMAMIAANQAHALVEAAIQAAKDRIGAAQAALQTAESDEGDSPNITAAAAYLREVTEEAAAAAEQDLAAAKAATNAVAAAVAQVNLVMQEAARVAAQAVAVVPPAAPRQEAALAAVQAELAVAVAAAPAVVPPTAEVAAANQEDAAAKPPKHKKLIVPESDDENEYPADDPLAFVSRSIEALRQAIEAGNLNDENSFRVWIDHAYAVEKVLAAVEAAEDPVVAQALDAEQAVAAATPKPAAAPSAGAAAPAAAAAPKPAAATPKPAAAPAAAAAAPKPAAAAPASAPSVAGGAAAAAGTPAAAAPKPAAGTPAAAPKPAVGTPAAAAAAAAAAAPAAAIVPPVAGAAAAAAPLVAGDAAAAPAAVVQPAEAAAPGSAAADAANDSGREDEVEALKEDKKPENAIQAACDAYLPVLAHCAFAEQSLWFDVYALFKDIPLEKRVALFEKAQKLLEARGSEARAAKRSPSDPLNLSIALDVDDNNSKMHLGRSKHQVEQLAWIMDRLINIAKTKETVVNQVADKASSEPNEVVDVLGSTYQITALLTQSNAADPGQGINVKTQCLEALKETICPSQDYLKELEITDKKALENSAQEGNRKIRDTLEETVLAANCCAAKVEMISTDNSGVRLLKERAKKQAELSHVKNEADLRLDESMVKAFAHSASKDVYLLDESKIEQEHRELRQKYEDKPSVVIASYTLNAHDPNTYGILKRKTDPAQHILVSGCQRKDANTICTPKGALVQKFRKEFLTNPRISEADRKVLEGALRKAGHKLWHKSEKEEKPAPADIQFLLIPANGEYQLRVEVKGQRLGMKEVRKALEGVEVKCPVTGERISGWDWYARSMTNAIAKTICDIPEDASKPAGDKKYMATEMSGLSDYEADNFVKPVFAMEDDVAVTKSAMETHEQRRPRPGSHN